MEISLRINERIIDMTEVLQWILVSLIGIIGYFLRDVHVSFKYHRIKSEEKELRLSEDLGKLKGKIEMVQQQASNDISRIEQITQLKLDQISKDVAKLTEVITKLLDQRLNLAN